MTQIKHNPKGNSIKQEKQRPRGRVKSAERKNLSMLAFLLVLPIYEWKTRSLDSNKKNHTNHARFETIDHGSAQFLPFEMKEILNTENVIDKFKRFWLIDFTFFANNGIISLLKDTKNYSR
ncbi:MAG: hypothetical protein Ta2E_00280 [Mycoplasmoidaceae bacterium]|nr:MAG: hypothetical protein Ta2E_00280 [Mycoplasmoidaceae bacterium]